MSAFRWPVGLEARPLLTSQPTVDLGSLLSRTLRASSRELLRWLVMAREGLARVESSPPAADEGRTYESLDSQQAAWAQIHGTLSQSVLCHRLCFIWCVREGAPLATCVGRGREANPQVTRSKAATANQSRSRPGGMAQASVRTWP